MFTTSFTSSDNYADDSIRELDVGCGPGTAGIYLTKQLALILAVVFWHRRRTRMCKISSRCHKPTMYHIVHA